MFFRMLAAAVRRFRRRPPPAGRGRRRAGRRGRKSIIGRCGTCPWPAPARSSRRREMRSAANTQARINRRSGISVAAAAPTQSASRRGLEIDALACIGRALAVSGKCRRTCEQNVGQKPRSGASPRDRMRGRGRLRDSSRSCGRRSFLAHVLDHFPLARDQLQRSRSRPRPAGAKAPPQHGHAAGDG